MRKAWQKSATKYLVLRLPVGNFCLFSMIAKNSTDFSKNVSQLSLKSQISQVSRRKTKTMPILLKTEVEMAVYKLNFNRFNFMPKELRIGSRHLYIIFFDIFLLYIIFGPSTTCLELKLLLKRTRSSTGFSERSQAINLKFLPSCCLVC